MLMMVLTMVVVAEMQSRAKERRKKAEIAQLPKQVKLLNVQSRYSLTTQMKVTDIYSN